jgi:hypothetical protein
LFFGLAGGVAVYVICLIVAAVVVGVKPLDAWALIKTAGVASVVGTIGAMSAMVFASDVGLGPLFIVVVVALLRFGATVGCCLAWVTDLTKSLIIAAITMVVEVLFQIGVILLLALSVVS